MAGFGAGRGVGEEPAVKQGGAELEVDEGDSEAEDADCECRGDEREDCERNGENE